MKANCSISAEQQSVLLIYYLYKTIHMDAMISAQLDFSLVNVSDFHHFS